MKKQIGNDVNSRVLSRLIRLQKIYKSIIDREEKEINELYRVAPLEQNIEYKSGYVDGIKWASKKIDNIIKGLTYGKDEIHKQS